MLCANCARGPLARLRANPFWRRNDMRQSALSNHCASGKTAATSRFAIWSSIALLMVLILAPHAAVAQLAGNGAISGTVTDPTGAVISNATITAVAAATN